MHVGRMGFLDRKEGAGGEAQPAKPVWTGGLERPDFRLAGLFVLGLEVEPRMRVDPVDPHQLALLLDALAHVELCRDRVMPRGLTAAQNKGRRGTDGRDEACVLPPVPQVFAGYLGR